MEKATQKKTIEQAFPNLELKGETAEYLSQARVTRVCFDRRRNVLHIYIESPQWIHKKHIFGLEREIKRQLFADSDFRVKVNEHFTLSKQYTPGRLFEVYRSSMLLELSSADVILAYVMRTARISFPGEDTVSLLVEDTVPGRDNADRLARYIGRVFSERCGMPVSVETDYYQVRAYEDLEYCEMQMRSEVGSIMEGSEKGRKILAESAARQYHTGRDYEEGQNSGGTPEKAAASQAEISRNPAEGETAALTTEKSRPAAAGEAHYSGRKGKRHSFGDTGSLRQSDNPDVIYGKDFDGDSIPIETIDESVSECVIRGEIISCDTRDIRNEK